MKKRGANLWNQIANISNEDLEKSSEKVEIGPLPPQVKREKREKQTAEDKPLKSTKMKSQKEIRKKEEVAEESWFPEEEITGQLSVDLYDDGDELIVESTIAGVKPEDVDISVEPDLITIRGARKKEKEINKKSYFYRECFWGGFSRTLVLPVAVKPDEVRANIKNGILTVALPKASEKSSNIKVK